MKQLSRGDALQRILFTDEKIFTVEPLQQDWAPAHGAKKTLEWCEASLPGFWTKNVWPSNSPDLNSLDYAIWGIMEKKACAIKHKSIDSLKRALEKA
ncbi:hypothetical protein QR680_009633 [Steinernema hermaphroditum]|uniref:Tc1-like transposase DDE domain-containing protein n=1 Tax=Steinernema hermaphroditum TaxID=289476 RepID=A0AA39M9U0_9BILA|nr:hypothetical protein QR680_009633 [Steinernema hermaphroditum]